MPKWLWGPPFWSGHSILSCLSLSMRRRLQVFIYYHPPAWALLPGHMIMHLLCFGRCPTVIESHWGGFGKFFFHRWECFCLVCSPGPFTILPEECSHVVSGWQVGEWIFLADSPFPKRGIALESLRIPSCLGELKFFAGSAQTPSFSMLWPSNVMEALLNSHLVVFNMTPACSMHLRTANNHAPCSSLLLANTSTYSNPSGRLSNIHEITQSHSIAECDPV